MIQDKYYDAFEMTFEIPLHASISSDEDLDKLMQPRSGDVDIVGGSDSTLMIVGILVIIFLFVGILANIS